MGVHILYSQMHIGFEQHGKDEANETGEGISSGNELIYRIPTRTSNITNEIFIAENLEPSASCYSFFSSLTLVISGSDKIITWLQNNADEFH